MAMGGEVPRTGGRESIGAEHDATSTRATVRCAHPWSLDQPTELPLKTFALLFAIIAAVIALAACSDRQPTADTPAPNVATSVDTTPAMPEPVIDDPDASAAPATPPAAPGAAKVEADYLGRWTGVEGTYLVVASKPGGGVTLDMQWDLDNKGMFDGSVTAEGLRFVRNGVAESAVHTDGDATGLKYLAGKQECLTVKPGEGYCRD